MSPVKNKEDTWKASELEKHIRTMKDDKGTSSKSKRHDDDKDRQEKRHRDDSVKKRRDEGDRRNQDDKERRPKDDRERRPPGDSDRKRRDDSKGHRDDRERRHQDDSDRRHRDDEKRHRDENDREKSRTSKTKESRDLEKTSSSRHRDEDDDDRRRRREERKRREAEEESGGGDRDHRRHRERDDRDNDGKRHRDRDTDGERRRDRDRDEKREKHRTNKEELESKPRKREEKERSGDDDAERRHRRHKEERDRDQTTRDKGDNEGRSQKQRDKYKEEDERGRDDRDRDGRKHRREKEATDGESVDRDKRRGRSEKTEKEERRKKQAEPEKAKKYDEYEDDFEAYEDDFDAGGASGDSDASDHYEKKKSKATKKTKPADVNSGDGSGRSGEGGKEMDDILRALEDENRRLLSASPVHRKEEERRQSKKKETLPPPSSDRPTFINFVSAKQRTVTGKTSKKIRTRANDLMNLIEFDMVSFTLFEQHSEKEYDRFIRSFGRMNAMQVYVQTNEDDLDQEIQTEEIVLREKWSQHPPEAGVPPCGGDSDPSSSGDFGQLIYKVPWDTALEKGIRVIETLLEENNMEYMHKNVGHKQSNIVVSEAFVELTSVSILRGRHVISSQFSPDQNHLLLAAYSRWDKNSGESNPLQTKGIVCVWNVYEPSRPQKILVCPSQPLCGCFSPVKSTLVFAGLEDGVIVTWDLREPDNLHKRITYDNVEYVLRHPTYSTAMPYLHDSHSSPVIKLAPIVSNSSKGSVSGSTTAEECLSFQLASLEQNSVIVLWVVVELDRPDPVGSTSDFGLREGGRVKLVKSSVIKLESPRSVRNSVLETTFESTDLQVWPKDNSQFIVATASTGCVLHATRHGGHISPKAFRPKSDYPFDVTSVDFSPFLSSIFLAGGSDGSIRLFRVDLSHALMTWNDATDGRSIQMVRWCRSRPSVFFVLDEDSFIYIWDLHMDDGNALKKDEMAKSRVTSICLSNDHSATGQGLPDRPPQMAVFLETGVAEAHIIKKEFSALMPDEIRQFTTFINKAIL